MKKTSKKVIAVTLSASMLLGGSMTAMAATTNPDISQREIDHKTAAKNIAAQGMVLMENKNNSLPISAKKGTKVDCSDRVFTTPSKAVPVPVL